MPWRENHADGGFTIHLDRVRWCDYHGETVQWLRANYQAGNLVLFGKLDTARLVETALRMQGSHRWIRCLLMYDDLHEAIGDAAINHLIHCQREFEAKRPE
jgi:hypothetical protein